MTTAVSSIVRRTLRKDDEKLKILCFFLDGIFEETLLKTGHIFYGSSASYAGLSVIPNKQLYELPNNFDEVPKDINFDMIICNYRSGQLDSAKKLSSALHIPLIVIEHHLMSTKLREVLKNTIYTSEHLQNHYNGQEYIPYTADIEFTNKDRNIDIFVYGQFNNKDRSIIEYLQSLHFNLVVGGNNPGISERMTIAEIKEKMLNSKIFLNLSYPNFTSNLLFYAMGCGCIIISNSTPLTEHFIKHEETGLLEKNLTDFPIAINTALNKPELGINAQNYIKLHHNPTSVVEQWSNKLSEISKQVYIQ